MDKFKLNETLIPLNNNEWEKLNQNWDRIKSYLRDLQRQLSTLSGGEEVTELLNLIDQATQDAIEAERLALTAASEAETAKFETETATTNANNKANLAQQKADLAQDKIEFIEAHEQQIEFFTSIQTNLQAQINQLVADGDSSPEAAQARVGSDDTVYSTLKARLDDEHQKVTQQLAQNGLKMNKELISSKQQIAQIGIIDDDGCIEIMTRWLPILQSGRKFALDIAVITDKVGKTGYCSWEQLEQLKRDYPDIVDLINHSHTHPEHATLTEDQLIQEFSTSYEILSKRGHTADVYVYPYGSVNELTRKVARRYTRAAFWDQGGSNSLPLQQFQIRRTLLMDTTSMPSLDTLKGYVDSAITNNHLLVFMSHSQFGGFDISKVQELIDYINTKVNEGLIEWVNAKDAIDTRGNILDVGDYVSGGTNNYKIIDALGRYHSNDSRLTHFNSNVYNTTPLTDFQYGLTYSEIFGDKVTGFPSNTSGLLETYRDLSGNFSHQRYRPYATNQLHQRIWNQSTGAWRDWDEISTKTIYDHTKNNSHLATEYRIGCHTISLVPDASASGLPHNQGGTLETYRLGNDVYTYQTFKPRGLNKMFTRRWNGSVWSEWLNINGIYGVSYANINRSIASKQVVNVEIATLNGANTNIIVSTVGGLEVGLMYSVVTDNTKAFVRLFNPTDNDITINRDFKYNLIYNS